MTDLAHSRADMSVQDALPVPPDVVGDDSAFEMLRVWGASGRQHVSYMPVPNGNPALWGAFFADLMRQLASSYEDDYATPVEESLQSMRSAFEAELRKPHAFSNGRDIRRAN